MGLGKTISVLALIAGSLDLQDIPPNDMIGTGRDHPTTLLVTPLSSRSLPNEFSVSIRERSNKSVAIINWEKQIAE